MHRYRFSPRERLATFTAHSCNIDGRKVCEGNEECGSKGDNPTGIATVQEVVGS